MKVRNMTNSNGRAVPNQFIITDFDLGMGKTVRYFQSYKSIICRIVENDNTVVLDEKYWNYSITTGKYRNQFLGETKKEIQAKIDNGEYVLTNLN